MRLVAGDDLSETYLPPGGLFAAAAPCVIGTLVGSCVAVTLWCPSARVGGMNHYLLPRQPNGEGSPRYGDTAMAMLLARLQTLGCDLADLEARVYGGATVLTTLPASAPLGEQNVLTAWRFLRTHRVRVVDEQTGGATARRVRLDVASGTVVVTNPGQR